MDELLLVQEWEEPDSLASQLREALPDEYLVIADVLIQGHQLDAVVVGPQGLFVLYDRDWVGEIGPSRRGPWQGQLPSQRAVEYPNPAEDVEAATRALNDFLQDEFPDLEVSGHHLLILTSPEARLTTSQVTDPLVLNQKDAAVSIQAIPPALDGAPLDHEARAALALALRQRRLTSSQRASQPFVFRSGGRFGSGREIWTLRDVVHHMDKNPEDGIFHLNNGTLVRWLSEQGADHLAELARKVTCQPETDPRQPLETFLLGTGFVRRPRISMRPRRVDLGCVSVGEESGGRLSLQKGRGRGYLFGKLRTSAPWLRVEPETFGGPVEALISADTSELFISRKPWQAEILVDSNASEEPIELPVQVRVTGFPSTLDRYLLRPAAGALSAGTLGLILGWSIGHWSMRPPDWFTAWNSSPAVWALACALVVGLLWALLGGIRGALQPLAWPVSYSLGRFFLRAAVWGGALVVLAIVGHVAWGLLGPGSADASSGIVLLGAVQLALAVAIVPATVEELRSYRRAKGSPVPARRRPAARPLLYAAAAIVLVLFVVLGARFVVPTWQRLEADGAWSNAQDWGKEQWNGLEIGINDAVDDLLIRYYDRRAPVSPTVTPTPGPTPTSQTGDRTP